LPGAGARPVLAAGGHERMLLPAAQSEQVRAPECIWGAISPTICCQSIASPLLLGGTEQQVLAPSVLRCAGSARLYQAEVTGRPIEVSQAASSRLRAMCPKGAAKPRSSWSLTPYSTASAGRGDLLRRRLDGSSQPRRRRLGFPALRCRQKSGVARCKAVHPRQKIIHAGSPPAPKPCGPGGTIRAAAADLADLGQMAQAWPEQHAGG
jgi:hypothetical protein